MLQTQPGAPVRGLHQEASTASLGDWYCSEREVRDATCGGGFKKLLSYDDDASTMTYSDSECDSQDELNDNAAPSRLSDGTETLGMWWSKENLDMRAWQSDMSRGNSIDREIKVLNFDESGHASEPRIFWEQAYFRDLVKMLGEVEDDEAKRESSKSHPQAASSTTPSRFQFLKRLVTAKCEAFYEGSRSRYAPPCLRDA